MEPSSIITLDMVRPGDVLVIDGQERFAGAVYYSEANMYRWIDIVLSGGDREEALELSLLDGIDKWYVVHFVAKLAPEDIGLLRGSRLPDFLTFEGDRYTLGSGGQTTMRRVDRRESELYAHFADYVSGINHIGVEIYDVSDAVYAGEAEIWHGHEIGIDDINLLPIDTDKKREGVLTQQIYRPLPSSDQKHWWQKALPKE